MLALQQRLLHTLLQRLGVEIKAAKERSRSASSST